MPKDVMRFFVLGLVVLFIAGCTGSVGVRARSYVEEKPRVDQSMEGGNYGYLTGQPVPEDRSGYKKDRKIYVLELTKEAEELEEEPVTTTAGPQVKLPPRKEPKPPEWAQPIVIPPVEKGRAPEPTSKTTSFVDYQVQKDDTLQKISKKFYDTYRKWPRIYDANKEVLKDPNRLKPGIMLKIPVE